MPLDSRPYWKESPPGGPGGGVMRGLTVGMGKPGRIVKYLLVINVSVFVLQLLCRAALGYDLSELFGATLGGRWQIWRYVTFQFLHSPDSLWHIGLNMLGLYMLGTPLENHWGPKQFLRFYLICGSAAGIAYVVTAALLGLPRGWPLIGASGGVYAIVLACAVLFPEFRLIIFVFPVPIRMAAAIIFGGMILFVLRSLGAGNVGPGFWSNVAHLGGAVTAAIWIWAMPPLRSAVRQGQVRLNEGAWRRKIERRRRDQEETDRILEKVRRQGLDSLSRSERQALQDATRRQRREDRELHKL